MKCWLVTLIALSCCAASVLCVLPSTYDLCDVPSPEGLTEATKKDSLPRAGVKAGNYSVMTKHSGNVVECAEACCKNSAGQRCDVALFRTLKKKKTCILVTCDPKIPDGCDPVSRPGDPKFQDSVMIRVRRQGQPVVAKSPKTRPVRERMCSPDDRVSHCPKGELCEPQSKDGSFICICPPGHRRVPSTKSDYGECEAPPTAGSAPKRQVKVCEYGLNECGPNQRCVVRTIHSKNGVCRCNKGFMRDASGNCVEHPAVPEHPANTTVAPTTGNVTRPVATRASYGPSPANVTAIPTPTVPYATPEPSPSPVPTPEPSTSTASVISTKATATKPLPPDPTTAERRPAGEKKPTDETSTVANATVQPLRKVTILLDKNYTIQLPQNELTLHAKVQSPPEDKLNYKWSLISSPDGAEKGIIDGKGSLNLHLSKLIAGEYMFKLVVQGRHSYGETTVKVVVLPPKRINKPPVAIVKSATEVVQLPNNLVLDGTRSSDDDRVVSYHWEEVSGPLGHQDMKGADKGILELKGLTPGNYVFKLTVTDSDGATNSTEVHVTVKKEKDYPPTANAGQTVVLQLPKNSVTLYGNASTDDHGIKSYEWVKISNDKLTADMQGVREPVLRLSHLEVGDYVFQLKVTDNAGQSSTADVKVYVNPRQNVAPTANAGGDKMVTLPLQITTLDGSKSEDDDKIVRYEWTQISGPHTLIIKDGDKAKAEVSSLKVGVYQFRLTVWDKEKLRSEDTMKLTVQESHNLPPKAHAGDDQIVMLPKNLVRLDGSGSWDDKKIVSYRWRRTEESLAAGTVLNNSDHQAVLLLTDLVPGKYAFSLEVTDKEGQRDSDLINLLVKTDPNLKNMLEIRFKGDLATFTENNEKDLLNQFKLLLSKAFPDGEIKVHVQRIRQVFASGSIVIRFYVTKRMRASNTVLPGRDVLTVLRKRLSAGVTLLDLVIERVDTAVCLSNCSGHGRCHPLTRQCVCEAFWMENSLRVHYGDGEHNCDWSILYVIVLAFLAVLVVAAMVWLVVWCKRRWRRPRTKRHKYTLLNEFDEKDGGLKLPGLPHRLGGKSKPRRNGNGGSGNGSGAGGGGGGTESGMVASESDLTSDEEETLFINKRPVNGGVGAAVQGENKPYLRSNGVAGAL